MDEAAEVDEVDEVEPPRYMNRLLIFSFLFSDYNTRKEKCILLNLIFCSKIVEIWR